MAAVVRCTSTANGAPSPGNRNPTPPPSPVAARRLLSVSKPCWIVRTEEGQITSNWECFLKESGQNGVGIVVGVGLDTAIGTGEYRYIMGVHMKKDSDPWRLSRFAHVHRATA